MSVDILNHVSDRFSIAFSPSLPIKFIHIEDSSSKGMLLNLFYFPECVYFWNLKTLFLFVFVSIRFQSLSEIFDGYGIIEHNETCMESTQCIDT